MSQAFDVSDSLKSLLDTLRCHGFVVEVVDGANSLPALYIKSGTQSILFKQAAFGLLDRLAESTAADFCDMLSAMDDEDIEPLLVTGSRYGFVWLVSAVRTQQGEWDGMLAECPRLENIDTRYGLRMSVDDQERYLRDLFSSFNSWLPEGCPLRNVSDTNGAVLVARVDPEEMWFLRLPISVYACSSGYPLRQYRSLEYIVSGKSLTQYLYERRDTRSGLRHAGTLLRNTVVIINTYPHLLKVDRAVRGTELLIEALSLFRDITIDEATLTLRWYLNPSHETIVSVLEDKSVTFFFANFESGNGKWEIGIGPRRSWDGREPGEVSEKEEFFEFAGRSYDLSHIQLMRVYHCNAAFRPAEACRDGRNPADERSIVHQLLAAGARRVEGGLTRESYFDFLRSVIELLLSPQMKFIMEMKCWREGKDCNELVRHMREFAPDAS